MQGSTPTPRATPSRTPGSSKSKVTPSLGVRTKTPGTGKTGADITDNLLDINLSKVNDKTKVNTDNLLKISCSSRPRSSDFWQKVKCLTITLSRLVFPDTNDARVQGRGY